jgi:hypothetical protein
MSIEQVQQEEKIRRDNFFRALDMANLVISRNPEILAYYWYLWNCRSRSYSLPVRAEQMTRLLVKRMPVPTEEQQLLLEQHVASFPVYVSNKPVIKFGKL